MSVPNHEPVAITVVQPLFDLHIGDLVQVIGRFSFLVGGQNNLAYALWCNVEVGDEG